jgi:cytochrome P450
MRWLNQALVRNPHRFFSWARRLSPVLRINLFEVKGWLVTGFDETEAVLKDPRFIKDRSKVLTAEEIARVPEYVMPVVRGIQRMILFMDPPDHTRLRRLISKAFTPGLIAKLRGDIEAICADLLDRRIGQTDHELVQDFTYPLPLRVISALLGVPDDERFRTWSRLFVRVVDLRASAEDWMQAVPAMAEFTRYLEALFVEKRAHPQPDLISGLLAAQDQDDRLTDQEVISTCMLLLVAGHETTANLIASGFHRLLKHPDQCERLKRNPSLMAGAIEEILRYDPPVFLTSRFASEDLRFEGRAVKKGHVMLLAIGAANRDPRLFASPNTFDITRAPNKHLAFSSGIHYCLGAALGRLEMEIALTALLTRLKQPATSREPQWRPSIVIHGLESLPLRATIV